MYNLKIVHHNIRNLNDKINELKLFIHTQPDIITLNETLTIKPSLKIPNYTITQPQNNIDKGVAIIHSNNINRLTTTNTHDNKHKKLTTLNNGTYAT